MNYDTEHALMHIDASFWIRDTLYNEIKDFSPRGRVSRDEAIDVLYWWFTSSDAYQKHYYHVADMCGMVNEVNPDNIDWDAILDALHEYGRDTLRNEEIRVHDGFEDDILEGLSMHDYA